MIKPEKIDHPNLVYHFIVSLMKSVFYVNNLTPSITRTEKAQKYLFF